VAAQLTPVTGVLLTVTRLAFSVDCEEVLMKKHLLFMLWYLPSELFLPTKDATIIHIGMCM